MSNLTILSEARTWIGEWVLAEGNSVGFIVRTSARGNAERFTRVAYEQRCNLQSYRSVGQEPPEYEPAIQAIEQAAAEALVRATAVEATAAKVTQDKLLCHPGGV